MPLVATGDSHEVRFLLASGRRSFLLILSALALFVTSTTLPFIASVVETEDLPVWVGCFDVGLAGVLFLTAIVIDRVGRQTIDDSIRSSSYELYRIAICFPLLLLMVFLFAGDRIHWNVLLPGLAWRSWLILHVLPAGIGLWRTEDPSACKEHFR